MPYFGHSEFLAVFLHQNGMKKFRMPNFGCSEFVPVFLHQNEKIQNAQFCKKNLEWPILGIPNFFKSFWCKNTGRNSEWPKLGIPKFFNHSSAKNTGRNLELGQNWVFQTFLNHFSAKRLEDVRKSVWFTLN